MTAEEVRLIMATQQLRVHISADGVIDPIPNWTGGEREVVVTLPQTHDVSEPPQNSILCMESQIRLNRLEDRYGKKSSEERKTAAKRFMETWDGVLANSPEMTVDEIRKERREARYGK